MVLLCLKRRRIRYNLVLVEILQRWLLFFLLPLDLNGVYCKHFTSLHTAVQSDEMRYPAVGFVAMNIIIYFYA